MRAIRRVLHILCLGLFVGPGPLLAQQPDATKLIRITRRPPLPRHGRNAWLSGPTMSSIRLDPSLHLVGVKPTLSMLTNSERVRPKDRQLAELAIKTNEKCRQAYSTPFAFLPPQVSNVIDGVYRTQDALIAELYIGKITFGSFNTKMDRLFGDLSCTLSGIPYHQAATQTPPNLGNAAPPSGAADQIGQSSRQRQQPVAAKITKIALVIGNGRYTNLPRSF